MWIKSRLLLCLTLCTLGTTIRQLGIMYTMYTTPRYLAQTFPVTKSRRSLNTSYNSHLDVSKTSMWTWQRFRRTYIPPRESVTLLDRVTSLQPMPISNPLVSVVLNTADEGAEVEKRYGGRFSGI